MARPLSSGLITINNFSVVHFGWSKLKALMRMVWATFKTSEKHIFVQLQKYFLLVIRPSAGIKIVSKSYALSKYEYGHWTLHDMKSLVGIGATFSVSINIFRHGLVSRT